MTKNVFIADFNHMSAYIVPQFDPNERTYQRFITVECKSSKQMVQTVRLFYSPILKLERLDAILFERLLWQYWLWSFQAGGTKLERFLHKSQHTQRKLLNFESWCNGEVSKSAKI